MVSLHIQFLLSYMFGWHNRIHIQSIYGSLKISNDYVLIQYTGNKNTDEQEVLYLHMLPADYKTP